MTDTDLTVAVTGPTGTFGHGLVPLLQQDSRIRTVVGIARRPFDPAVEGWTKMEYRQGDVRDEDLLAEAFAGADVVVHLAFLVVGGASGAARDVNVEGTRNAFRAAARAGARRFVYASSVSAYGFFADTPELVTEDWPTRPAARLAYAQEKAEVEEVLRAEAEGRPSLELFLLRPPVVVGPHTIGAKVQLPGPLAPWSSHLDKGLRRLPLPLPAVVPDFRLQLVHEEDVGRALLQCVVGAGPAGAYNVAGDGVVTLVDAARELGLVPLRAPARPLQQAMGVLAKAPFLPRRAQWVEALSQPVIMDCTRAKQQLGWKPRFTGVEALRDALTR